MVVKTKEFKLTQIDDSIYCDLLAYRPCRMITNKNTYECIDLSYNLREIKSIIFIVSGCVVCKISIPRGNVYYNDTVYSSSKIEEIVRENLDIDGIKEWGELYV